MRSATSGTKSWSLRRRLVLTTAAVVCGGMAWLAWWQADLLRPRWWEAMEESLVDTAMVLAAAVADGSPGPDPDPAALARVWPAARAAPLHATIYATTKTALALEVSLTDRYGIVLYDSARPQDVGRDNSQWNDVLRTLRGQYGARATRHDPADPASDWLHVAAPVRRDGVLIGVLTVAKPVGAVAAVAAAARLQLIASAVVVAAAMAGLGFLITAWITLPLARLTTHVRRAAAGRREPLPALGRGEIAELGSALQDLRQQLDGRRYVEEYVQALTHELKSPLAGVRAAAELLQEDLPPTDRARFLANLRGESERLHALIERLLALTALERREALSEIAEVELSGLVAEVAADLAARCAAGQVGISLSGPGGVVRGDRFLLRQACENLLGNALAVAPPGSQITVEVLPDALVVRDQGPGIPDFALARLGERFFSLPHPATGRKGTGLGLAFVREIARLHGGRCLIANHPGGGAEARLELALAPPSVHTESIDDR